MELLAFPKDPNHSADFQKVTKETCIGSDIVPEDPDRYGMYPDHPLDMYKYRQAIVLHRQSSSHRDSTYEDLLWYCTNKACAFKGRYLFTELRISDKVPCFDIGITTVNMNKESKVTDHVVDHAYILETIDEYEWVHHSLLTKPYSAVGPDINDLLRQEFFQEKDDSKQVTIRLMYKCANVGG